MEHKSKMLEFNFIKAICAIGIVIFHFSIETENSMLLLGNYSWGSIFVTIFFMVSGTLLYYNYSEPKNIKIFYYKRWKSLMPDFYVAFLCLYIVQVIKNRSFFYNGNPMTFLLTLIGQDGYFYNIIPNYYILGEWFLGAILILYVLYPFLARMINKCQLLTIVIISALYAASLIINISYIRDFRSIFSCIFSFMLGIVIEKNKLYQYKWLIIPALVCFITENYLTTNNEVNLSSHIGGVSLFFIFFSIGHLICCNNMLSKLSDFLSNISYSVFLVHHVMLMHIIKIIPNSNSILVNIICLIFSLVLIVIVAAIFSKVMRVLKKLKVFYYIDRWILGKINRPEDTIIVSHRIRKDRDV